MTKNPQIQDLQKAIADLGISMIQVTEAYSNFAADLRYATTPTRIVRLDPDDPEVTFWHGTGDVVLKGGWPNGLAYPLDDVFKHFWVDRQRAFKVLDRLMKQDDGFYRIGYRAALVPDTKLVEYQHPAYKNSPTPTARLMATFSRTTNDFLVRPMKRGGKYLILQLTDFEGISSGDVLRVPH